MGQWASGLRGAVGGPPAGQAGLRRQGLATPRCGHVPQAGAADGAPGQAPSGTAVPCPSQLAGGLEGLSRGPNSTRTPHPPGETRPWGGRLEPKPLLPQFL